MQGLLLGRTTGSQRIPPEGGITRATQTGEKQKEQMGQHWQDRNPCVPDLGPNLFQF